MIRTKVPLGHMPFTDLGGHMPNPPEECKFAIGISGKRYADNSVCTHRCKLNCERRRQFDLEWKRYYNKVKSQEEK